jgi:hypothetical protein
MQNETYDRFTLNLVLLCVGVNVAIYICGAFLMSLAGMIFVILYLVYGLFLEIRLLMMSCRHCYYYGKLCAFGKGKLCALLFKKGSPDIFLTKKITCLNLVPDFLVSIIPLAVGVFYLFKDFSWLRLFLIVAMVILAFPVSGYIRKSVSCRYCRQKEAGCPAMQFFEKSKSV